MKLKTWVQTFVDGVNKPRDYPAERAREPFVLDRESADEMIHGFREHGSPLPVDFNHGMYQPIDGVPFPDRFERMGKIVDLQYRPGKGFYSLTEFTERGTEYIRRSEGAYFSGVVHIDPKSHKPKHLFGAALTPTPALNLEEIQAFSARTGTDAPEIILSNSIKINSGNQEIEQDSTAGNPPAGEKHMSENLKRIAVLLKADDETDPEKLAAKGITVLEGMAATRDVIALAVGLDPKTASLSEIGSKVKERLDANPDPAKFVSVDKLTELTAAKDALATEVAALKAKVLTHEAEAAVSKFMSGKEVKITPKMKPFAVALYCDSKEKFDQYVSGLSGQVSTEEVVTGEPPATDKNSVGRSAAVLAAEVDPRIELVPKKGK